MKEYDISTSDPESANGKMHALGFKKFHILRANGTKRHIFVKGDLELELNSYDSVMEYADRNNATPAKR